MKNSIKDYHIGSGRVLKEDDTFINWSDYLDSALNDFGELRTSMRYPQLTLNAGLPISQRRDYTANSQNGGNVTLVDGEYKVEATSATDSIGSIITRQRANYLSGGVIEGGIGLRVPTAPTGSAKVNWGFIEYDRTTAVQFSNQSTGVRLQVVNDGVTEVDVAQSDWNIDKLDGTGPSGVTLDMSTGYVTQIPGIYYGYGDWRFQIMAKVNGRKRVIDIHRESRDGQISIDRANLPLGVEVFGDGTALDAYVGGRQVNSTFPDSVRPRFTSGRRLSRGVTTTFRPLVSFKHKTGFNDIFCSTSGLEILTDTDLIIELRRNPTLTDDTFDYLDSYTESERALQYDIAATAVSGGETIFDTFAVSGQGNKPALRPVNVPPKFLSEFDTYSWCARTVSGSGTSSTIARNEEKW